MPVPDFNLVFAALAHPSRRQMLDLLRDTPGMSVAALAEHFAMSSVGVLKHVRVLERASLIHAEKHGREKRLYFNVVPIQLVYDRWTDQYSQFWAARLADIKERIESRRARPAARKESRRA